MYRRKSPEWLKHLDFEILDLLCMELSLMICFYLREGALLGAWNFDYYIILALLLLLVDLPAVYLGTTYHKIIQRGTWIELIQIIKHTSIVWGVITVIFYMTQTGIIFSRLTTAGSWGLGILTQFAVNSFRKQKIRKSLRDKGKVSQMMLITTADTVRNTLKLLENQKYHNYVIACVDLMDQIPGQSSIAGIATDLDILKDDIKKNPSAVGCDIICGKEAAREYARKHVVDDVFLDSYHNADEVMEQVNAFLEMGITMHIGVLEIPVSLPHRTMDHFGDFMAVSTSVQEPQSWKMGLKRIADVVGALVGLLITGLCAIVIVPAIKIADPGPVIFKQKRVGMNGRIFTFYKFRTMYMDAEERKAELMSKNEMKGFMFKMENDPRVIGSEKGPGKGLGNFLRRSSLDEFPQFFNVLKGDMSLVGTRPPTVDEYEQYERKHKIRLAMKPGITGLWQISGRSDITDFEEVVRLDTEYICSWSLGQDIKILFQTIPAVLKKTGSR